MHASESSLIWLAGEVPAGFPSPAEDFAAKPLDLHELLIAHPQATFFLRLRGESLRDAGILDGDIVVVDRALKPVGGDLVVAEVGHEFTCKFLRYRGRRPVLSAANPTYPDIVPDAEQGMRVFGVVTGIVRSLRPHGGVK